MDVTLSVLFTDAASSTEALVALGDRRYGAIQDAHLGLLRAAVATHGGREVKCLGDGMMAAFRDASGALACAVAMQQAVEAARRRGEDGLMLRVGIASGDVTVADDGDLHGAVVVAAARLCAAAEAGRILATDVTRALAGSRITHPISVLGPLELKGMSEPIVAVEVGWTPSRDDVPSPVPLPPRLATRADWPFVGRAREIAHLDAHRRAAAGGERRVVLIGGEPGAGKTRLACEVAISAHAEGALILFGRVDEGLALAYQPFAEALDRYLTHVDEPTRAQVLALRGGVLGRLVPALAGAPAPGPIDAWAMFEGLVDWLAVETPRRTVVLVLDDLHWAAEPTLRALMHVIRSERLGRLLVLGTYRDTELGPEDPLTTMLADLPRETGAERLDVDGLDADGVAAFVALAQGDVASDDDARFTTILREQTHGNPFFVGEILRHLDESDDAEGVPDGVRDVIERRVARLARPARDLLTVAAVAGQRFGTDIVAEVAGYAPAAALDGFDEAVQTRLLLETSTPGRLRFTHALVGQTLADGLSQLRRAHLHRDIALVLERRSGATGSDAVVAHLARHFAQAAAVGGAERAAFYTEQAAQLANARGAAQQAAVLLERSLALLPTADDPDGHRRERLYAQLSGCSWAVLGEDAAEAVSRRWLALAHELGDDAMRAKASVWLMASYAVRAVPAPADLTLFSEVLRVDFDRLDLTGCRRFSSRQVWSETDAPGLRAMLWVTVALARSVAVPLDALDDDLPDADLLGLADAAAAQAARSRDTEIVEEVN